MTSNDPASKFWTSLGSHSVMMWARLTLKLGAHVR
jgi:hypothetical protein